MYVGVDGGQRVVGLRRGVGSTKKIVPSSVATYNTCSIAEQAVGPWGEAGFLHILFFSVASFTSPGLCPCS